MPKTGILCKVGPFSEVTEFAKTWHVAKNTQVAQCTFLVPQVKNCQSPVFVIFMSKNLSTTAVAYGG